MVYIKNTKSRSSLKSKQGLSKKRKMKSSKKINRSTTIRRRKNKNRSSFKRGGSKNGCKQKDLSISAKIGYHPEF